MNRLNPYTWILAISYISIVILFEYRSYAVPWEGFYLTCPLVVIYILWSVGITPLLRTTKSTLNKTESFHLDLFLIQFSFVLGELLSFMVQYNNSDLAAWWPWVFWFMAFCGFIFAMVFSIIALMFESHKQYTLIFAKAILLLLPLLGYLAFVMPFSVFANTYTFYALLASLLLLHLCFSLGFRMYNKRE